MKLFPSLLSVPFFLPNANSDIWNLYTNLILVHQRTCMYSRGVSIFQNQNSMWLLKINRTVHCSFSWAILHQQLDFILVTYIHQSSTKKYFTPGILNKNSKKLKSSLLLSWVNTIPGKITIGSLAVLSVQFSTVLIPLKGKTNRSQRNQ